jgi:hypothetical protein
MDTKEICYCKKDIIPRSWGGAMARKQDGEALRQVVS